MTKSFTAADVTKLRVAIGRTFRSLDRRTNSPEISRTELTVLGTLNRLTKVPSSELAEFEGLNPTMLSRILGKLEAKGLLVRETDEADRRAVRAVITTEGRAVWEQQRKLRDDRLAELLSTLPEKDVESLLVALPALEALADASNAPRR